MEHEDFSSWTSCEMYGHDFDPETGRCNDCDESNGQEEEASE